MSHLRVTGVDYHLASPLDQRDGLLGWLRVEIGGSLVVDGVALRRTREGRHSLSFPARFDREGRRHYVVRPIHDLARRELECQVLRELRRQGRIAS